MPLTIFVTAYDEYALKAFEVHAFDYLLKPFGRERFHQAVARARTRLTEGLQEHLARRFVSLVHDAGSAPAASGRLMVKSGGRMMLLPLDELDAIESEGNYVRLHSGGTILSRPRHDGRHRSASWQRSLLPHPSRLDRQPRSRP